MVVLVAVGALGCSGSTNVTTTAPATATSEATPTIIPTPTTAAPATPTQPPNTTVVPPDGATPAAATPAPTGEPDPPDEAENAALPTWLRVNGFGPADFGASGEAARAAVEAVFGAPVEDTTNDECPGGPATIVRYDDFSLLIDGGTFAGWYYRASSPTLTTPSDVAPGTSREQLITIYDGVSIEESTLGQEFFYEVPAGFIGGFLSDDGLEVVALYAGTTCFFR